MRPPRLRSLLAFALVLASGAPAEAQYFGRNQVRYKKFDFRVLKTAHFDVYYYPEERAAVEHAARLIERWYARLSDVLEHDLRGRQPLVLYASHPEFQQTNALGGGEIGEGTGGATEVLKRRIVLPLAGPLSETDHVLGHELVHAFQYDITGQGRPGAGAALPGAIRLPLWFIEGMAEYLTLGPVDPHTAMWMRDAVTQEKLPKVQDLDHPRYFPYRWGQAFWSYVAGRWGDKAVGRILAAAGRTGSAEDTLKSELEIELDQLSTDWHAALRETYDPLRAATRAPDTFGRRVISEETQGGEVNVGPVLSPDGSKLSFLSERDLFSIDMFLADTGSGRVRQKVVKTAVDPHFESLQFIKSMGAFDPSGQRLAFGAIARGAPVLTVMDVARERKEREVPLPELGEIFNPTFSPDGKQVAFSAIVGGLTDLFTYDLERGALSRLTSDAFAELHPAWSPDGRWLAFATDRFTTKLETLALGNYRLALLDLETKEVRELPTFPEAKNINPQWSPDGASLYFLADRGGITNVYRLQVADGALAQVTNLYTGVSGITDLSPALSVASRTGQLAFSVYEDTDYDIYVVEDAAALRGAALGEASPELHAAALPPVARRRPLVATLNADPLTGLPPAQKFEEAEYSSKLSLDYVGQPTLSAGVDRFGTFVGGGTSLFFSDVLGNHELGVFFQVEGGVQDIAGGVSYLNRRSRWNWGLIAQQIPYRTGAFSVAGATLDGEPVIVEQAIIARQINRDLAALASYPFSKVSRVELIGGYRNISFDDRVQTLAYSARTGQVLVDEEEELPSPDGLHLGQVTGAFVYDTSIFGATSPILGRRLRLEAAGVGGTINHSTLLADLRQYFMPLRPYTLAFRLLHYGRFGGGAEDERLEPLYLGYPTLVRGYDIDSFGAEECGNVRGECPSFDRLNGSKLLVGNAELRFPLWGAFGGRSLYGPVPIELAVFADAGVAWTDRDQASFLGGSRDPVASVGGAARVNVFGFLVFQVDYVKPLDRAGKGWVWQFSFSPGF